MNNTVEHVEVYREPGRFAGWPANYGIWSWDDAEIVLGFTLGYMKAEEGLFHLRDRERPFTAMQARSLDRGRTWTAQPFPGRIPGNRGLLSADEHVVAVLSLEHALLQPECVNRPTPCPGGINFAAPGFAFMAGRTGLQQGASSYFYTSQDRCQTWDGPYALPMFGQTAVAARTDYLPLDTHDCLVFLTGNKADGNEGQTFCARTTDGGATFVFVSYIGPEIHGKDWAIMPASVRLSDGGILVARRRGKPVDGDRPWHHWIDLYCSDDTGVTWRHLSDPVPNAGINGNPPTLNCLPDGRLCLTYGFRDKPYGIRARLSEDDGRTWSNDIILRDDGGAPDLGYPRTVVFRDGTIVTAYYFEDEYAGERYIAATRWKP